MLLPKSKGLIPCRVRWPCWDISDSALRYQTWLRVSPVWAAAVRLSSISISYTFHTHAQLHFEFNAKISVRMLTCWHYYIFCIFLQQTPWKDPNRQWIVVTNKYFLRIISRIHLILLCHTAPLLSKNHGRRFGMDSTDVSLPGPSCCWIVPSNIFTSLKRFYHLNSTQCYGWDICRVSRCVCVFCKTRIIIINSERLGNGGYSSMIWHPSTSNCMMDCWLAVAW